MTEDYVSSRVEKSSNDLLDVISDFFLLFISVGRKRLMVEIPPMENETMPALKDFRPFLGYNDDDYESAKEFYADIGFKKLWDDGNSACEFDTGIGHRFLITLHHGLDRDRAGMMSLWVEDVDAWKAYLKPKKLDEKYSRVKVAEPTITEWGWRILYVWDPGGWLLHIGQPLSDPQPEL